MLHAPGVGALTEKFKVTAALVPMAFVAVMLTGVLAEVALGVPEITPVDVFRETPVGSAPELIA
jgi:hydrogenase/urease accessory protein HupE